MFVNSINVSPNIEAASCLRILTGLQKGNVVESACVVEVLMKFYLGYLELPGGMPLKNRELLMKIIEPYLALSRLPLL